MGLILYKLDSPLIQLHKTQKETKKNVRTKQLVVVIAAPLGPMCLPNNPVTLKPKNDKKTSKRYIF